MVHTEFYNTLIDKSLSGELISNEEALRLLQDQELDVLDIAVAAGKVRIHYHGKKVKIHHINNVQNGHCPEDCGYCGQSKVAKAELLKYTLKDEEAIVAEAREAKAGGAYRYCMVASGRGPSPRAIEFYTKVIGRIKNEIGIRTCLSAGLLDLEKAERLKEAGLDRFNHNLNTSEAHTENIVSTHTFEDRLNTIRVSRQAGLENCSGMIAGLGESNQDIIDVAMRLRELEVASIPVNLLIPIKGNRLFDFGQLDPQRVIRILSLFRFINPKAEIRIGGGREGHLRGMQSVALYPANSLFADGYLVTRGEEINQVIEMIEDAGFEVDTEGIEVPAFDQKASSAGKFAIDGNKNIMNPKTAVIETA